MVPAPLRHDDHHASCHLELLWPVVSHQSQGCSAIQDLHDFIALEMALPLTFSGKTASEDAPVAV
jgi:hypothetical protein